MNSCVKVFACFNLTFNFVWYWYISYAEKLLFFNQTRITSIATILRRIVKWRIYKNVNIFSHFNKLDSESIGIVGAWQTIRIQICIHTQQQKLKCEFYICIRTNRQIQVSKTSALLMQFARQEKSKRKYDWNVYCIAHTDSPSLYVQCASRTKKYLRFVFVRLIYIILIQKLLQFVSNGLKFAYHKSNNSKLNLTLLNKTNICIIKVLNFDCQFKNAKIYFDKLRLSVIVAVRITSIIVDWRSAIVDLFRIYVVALVFPNRYAEIHHSWIEQIWVIGVVFQNSNLISQHSSL